LKAAGSKAAAMAVPATLAAIHGLGPEATSKQIAALVYAAVHVTPDSALNIVRATVKLSPKAAPEIAAAAARAVPNPWKEVRYHRIASQAPAQMPPQLPPQPPGPKERDFKSSLGTEPDFKSSRKERDFKSSPADRSLLEPVEEELDPSTPGSTMSLAEAIVQTAVDAGGNLADVQRAVDEALFGDPGLLFSKVGDPRGISAVGTAGNSNYGNEPFDPSDPRVGKKRLHAPNIPDPQAVSR
jgi:hypothetical protein